MLYVVGLGSGSIENMTKEAFDTLESCSLIVGYGVYVDLIKDHFPHKEYYTTPMKQEIDRCKYAIEQAESGKEVAVISSGDAGVYGMASLIYELSENANVEIKIVSGVTAALSGGAVLGAPLSHDFAVISMSDLLTPFDLIERRIEGASMGDMVVVLYNPSSKKRADYLQKACDIMLKYKNENTVCGYVENIGREGERAVVTTLKDLRNTSVNMFTTVFIGNSQTRNIDGKMVTPRGYKNG